MSKSLANQQAINLIVSPSTKSLTDSDNFSEYPLIEKYLTFNILGKIYNVKQSLFEKHSKLFQETLFAESEKLDRFYDHNRQQYVIDISPLIFEKILQYYTTQELNEPSNVQINYFKETLDKFHIDTSSLDIDGRYERFVPRQKIFQLIHVILEYPECE